MNSFISSVLFKSAIFTFSQLIPNVEANVSCTCKRVASGLMSNSEIHLIRMTKLADSVQPISKVVLQIYQDNSYGLELCKSDALVEPRCFND